MIRVAIADDQELAREGFSLILDAQTEIEVVGTAGTGAEAVDIARSLSPDVMLMDVRMPGMDGIEATRAITEANAVTRVLILTTFDLDEYVHKALLAGASGFLLKDAPRSQLIEAVRTIHRGDVVLASQVTRRLMEEFLIGRPARAPPCWGSSPLARPRYLPWSPKVTRTPRSQAASSSSKRPSRPTSLEPSPSWLCATVCPRWSSHTSTA